MTKQEFDCLFRRWRATGDVALRNRLIESHLPMVNRVARILRGQLVDSVDVGDLQADGIFGLINALNSYDPDRGCHFATLASLRVRGAILDGLRRRDFVPRLTRDRAKRVAKATEAYRQDRGRQPTPSELQPLLMLDDARFKRVMNDQPVACEELDRPVHQNGEKPISSADLLEDRQQTDPDAKLDAANVINVVLREFGVSAALLLRLRYLEGASVSECIEALREKSESMLFYRLRKLLPLVKARLNRPPPRKARAA